MKTSAENSCITAHTPSKRVPTVTQPDISNLAQLLIGTTPGSMLRKLDNLEEFRGTVNSCFPLAMNELFADTIDFVARLERIFIAPNIRGIQVV
jgi:hypothetical protein